MQQIAAQKSDLAALPVSTDRNVNGVETSVNLDSSQQGENFRRFYDDAKAHEPTIASNTRAEHSEAQDTLKAQEVVKQTSREKDHLDNDKETISLPPVKTDQAEASPIEDDGTLAEASPIEDDDTSADNEKSGMGFIDLPPTEVDSASTNDPAVMTNWLEYVESLIGAQSTSSDSQIESDAEGVQTDGIDSELSALEAQFPEGMDSESLPQIAEYLIKQLDAQSGETLSKDTVAALKALASMLNPSQENGQSSLGIYTDTESSDLMSELDTDEALILSLIKEQLISDKDAKSIMTSVNNASGLNDASNSSMVSEESDIAIQSDEVLQSIAMMSPESAHKAAQAFAERIAALLPSDTPTAQKNALKASIVTGIDEYKQQLAQGHEPGIDLSSLVSDAAIEAQLSSSQMQRLAANTDAVAGQFMLLVNGTVHAANDALQNQFAQVDTHVAENNQIRAESSKSQLQLDGGDKGVNIHKPEGLQQLHEKIRWMVNARNSMAEIRLDPPELGSMQVRVNMSGDAASVSFVVQSQHAKDALTDAMPRLKEMLADQGIALGESEVRKDNSSQNGDESGQQLAGSNSHTNESGQNIDDDTIIIEQGITKQAMGGIDYYA